MLAILALIAFILAAVFQLLKDHPDWVLWLVIVGGILICCHAIFGWYRVRNGRTVA